MNKTLLFAALAVTLTLPARAEIQTREVDYRHGNTLLQGFFAWDAAKGKRPGVLVVHEWWGHNEHARRQARRLAEAGYVGFALDMFGKGKLAKHPDDAMAFVREATKDPEVTRARFLAALDTLKAHEAVDTAKVGAIGYCFGGTLVLSMARGGASLDAVASFHGGLGNLAPAAAGGVKARVLVLNGAADPMVTADQLGAFEREMREAGARFEVVNLEGAKHSFTNPDADAAGMEALAYSAEADRRSWEALLAMLGEVWSD
jgi:dienelactone hydrolase